MLARTALVSITLTVTATAAWAIPQVADACSCFPDADLQWPADGGQIAANDALRIISTCSGIEPSEFDVWINGEEATLVPTQRGPLTGFAIEPAPVPGATIDLRACPGYGSCEALEEIEDEIEGGILEASFTVGEEDGQAPTPPALARPTFEHTEVDQHAGDGCGSEVVGTRTAQDWTVELTHDPDADEALVYVIAVGPSDTEDHALRHHFVRDAGDPATVTLRRFPTAQEQDEDQEICVTVRAVDMAGNASDAVTDCQIVEADAVIPDEIIPDEEDSRAATEGCDCQSGEDPRGAAGMLAGLLGLWGLRRRRRQARADQRGPIRSKPV
ncbi:MAG: MYXO-CTERM sorting domain-containing protein [Myxococcota bacterium]